jgi:hypothetical protein
MVTEIELLESPDITRLDFCLWGWMKSEIYKRKVNTRGELLLRSLDAAARIKKREDQLRRTTHDLRTWVVKFTEVGRGIFEHLQRTAANLLFLCNKFFIENLN